jgi:Na+/melibiose symporter-like transporter
MQKLAMSFAGFFALQVLAFTGYEANTELTESALSGIKLLYNVIPGLFSLACLITLLYYKLGVKQYDKVLSELNAHK